MKKVLFALVIATSLVACGGSTSTETATDSTAVAADTTTATVDTTAVAPATDSVPAVK